MDAINIWFTIKLCTFGLVLILACVGALLKKK